jgi:hypothetical protein
MKIDDVLFDELQKRLSTRSIIFITRAKLYIHAF